MGANYRYNQFTDAKNFVNQTGEIHVIPSSSPYVIRLGEVPDKESGMTIKIMDFLAAAIVDSFATSITVTNGSWYSEGDIITVDSEQMTVSAISGNTLTVARGANGTVATTHVIATKIYIEGSMTEVAASPSERQFWPDYSTSADSDNDWNTGTILFNNADAGKIISINYTKTGSLAVVTPLTNYPHWYYDRGDGSDGDFIPIVSTTLAGGVYNFSNVIIPAGITITLTGCVEIKCLGVFVCAGIITANGADGISDTSSGVSSVYSGGKGCNGYLPNSGGDSESDGSTGYGGGAGGAGGAAYDKASSAGGSPAGSSLLDLLSPITNSNYMLFAKQIICGAGGGGGANSGGSGGGGGASIYITAQSVNVPGSITANGGNGGNGYNSSTVGYRSGGGGGGGGGAVVIVAETISNTGTISANGGTGGAQTNNSSYVGVAGSNGVVSLKELGVS